MTLLIVEAQDAMRATLRDFLQPVFPHLRILLAESAEQALALCESEQPELVLLDLGMPDGKGFELAARLRTCSPAPAVIATSYRIGPEYDARASSAGACALVARDRLATELAPTIAWALGLPLPPLHANAAPPPTPPTS